MESDGEACDINHVKAGACRLRWRSLGHGGTQGGKGGRDIVDSGRLNFGVIGGVGVEAR